MTLTIEQVRDTRFHLARRNGYDPQDVDTFVDKVETTLVTLAEENATLQQQVATLEALFPGRIDVGLGRSLGFTAAVRQSLREDADAADRFLEDVRELQGFLGGTAPVTAQPQNQPQGHGTGKLL